jgi:hypothetical protein
VPCQDASLSATARSADGLSIGLMAVADGHGGSRYWLSDVGSRLACELALRLTSEDMASRCLGAAGAAELEEAYRWLAHDLPRRLLAAWQAAIAADWRRRELPEAHAGEAFSAQTYGSTLALVVLTPRWWGHTGLGDWDLVLLSNDQPDRIISQEADDGLHGEATQSLCLTRAADFFIARTAVYSLSGDLSQPCGLLLSTDGVRKSCATDADHLALSRFLLEEAEAVQASAAGETLRLDASLDRISREGSGDDVSVALACFGRLRAGAARQQTATTEPTLQELEPEPELSTPPPPPLPALTSENRPAAHVRGQRRQPLISLPMLVALMAAGALAAGAVLLLLRMGTRSQAPAAAPAPQAPVLSPAAQAGLRLEIKRQCGDPERIASNLRNRRSQFRSSDADPEATERRLAAGDWLGGLIALSRPGGPGLATLEPCQELAAALRQHWQTLSILTAPAAGSDDNGVRTGTNDPLGPGAAGSSRRAVTGSANH